MRQSIATKVLGPTNYRGQRIKAECEAGSIIVGWIPSLNVEDNHLAAATALMEKLNWHRLGLKLAGGATKTGYCFVMIEEGAK